MIVDVTGIVLTPGNQGKNCLGNGTHRDLSGAIIECCCDECDYFLCCSENHNKTECAQCVDPECPHAIGIDISRYYV